MAVATTWVLATGSRVEDATLGDHLPAHFHMPPSCPRLTDRYPGGKRPVSVFLLGLAAAQDQLRRKCGWRCLWLAPEPWPEDPPGLTVTRHHGTEEAA